MQQSRGIRRLLAGIAFAAAAATATAAFSATAAQAAAPAEGTVRGADAAGAIKDRYIVVFKDGSTESSRVTKSAADLAARFGGTVNRSFDSAVHGFSAKLTEAAAKRLAANPAVAYVEQDHQVRVAATQTNPPSWGLDRIDQTALPLSNSYTYPTNASNVTAYVIDTGVRITNTDFGGRASYGYDFVDNDANADDCFGHGTHVAGTIGGNTYGVAKGVKLVAVRVLDCQGSGSYSQIIAGVDWVTKNAVKPAVANMSLGGDAGSTLDDAVRKSIASGVTYAVAGGNDNVNACNVSPARVAEAITVGATDANDARASFSNWGTCLDIFAPGVNILSTYNTSDTATTRMSGTSMATPHVAGAAALLLANNPTLTPQQVRDALVANAVSGKVTNAGTGSVNKLLNISTAAAPAPVPTPAPTACAPVTNGYDKAIPDVSTVDSKMTVSGCTGNASATSKVEVHVKHSDRGDLAIWLIAPDGTAYKLKAATSGDDVANLDATYTVNLSAKARNGLWLLRVKDVFAGDTGYIDTWTLTL
jgi:subtilisin family serine protease